MKKFCVLLLSLGILFVLCACGVNAPAETTVPVETTSVSSYTPNHERID